MLARFNSKYFKAGFSSKGIENFQMYKLHLGKAEESDQVADNCCILKKLEEFHKNV